MAKVVSCKDGGVDCNWTGRAETEEELLKQIKEHAQKDHGMQEIPEELKTKIKSLIRDE